MIRFTKTHTARGLLPCAATVLTLTLAASLKIERSCPQDSFPTQTAPSVFYPYPELVSVPNLIAAPDSWWRKMYRRREYPPRSLRGW